ncbi:uncharacterized protein LOC131618886 [Vicia villosa]|uniref:uncharacterized protein LOC131618886 n=1 Tax=Vicia villosa TaxID=3911 RepID=UPI00273AA3E2|nr:uncharacterized protein LOC131618886 [Vicia villosa]
MGEVRGVGRSKRKSNGNQIIECPIIEYLKDPSMNTDKKTKYRALSYILMGNKLFKKTPEGILLKCLGKNEAYLALSNVHSGTCGVHQAGHKMKWLLFRYGMYWLTMLKDYIEFAKGCQECQIHAGIQHAPASELHAIIKPWPFRGWALDLIGEIRPTSSKGQRYILVGIDYFTKWVEAVPLVNVDQETVIDFIQRKILYRFGIQETITTNQGLVFTGRKMQELSEEMGFKLLTSTPYYAQANGQVVEANKVSIVLLVEIYLQSVRIQKQVEIPNNLYLEMMMIELTELDEERLLVLEVLRRQKERVARAYNKRVKGKTFVINNLLWKAILPMDKKNKALGKWSPHWEGPFRILKAFSNNAYEVEELEEDRRILKVNGKYLKKYKPFMHGVKITTT